MLLYVYPNAIAMAAKLRRIHALNGRDSIAKIAAMCYKHWVFKYITASWQLAKEKVGTGIFGAFIIAQAALPLVLADDVYRFHGCSTHVFHMYVLHMVVYF